MIGNPHNLLVTTRSTIRPKWAPAMHSHSKRRARPVFPLAGKAHSPGVRAAPRKCAAPPFRPADEFLNNERFGILRLSLLLFALLRPDTSSRVHRCAGSRKPFHRRPANATPPSERSAVRECQFKLADQFRDRWPDRLGLRCQTVGLANDLPGNHLADGFEQVGKPSPNRADIGTTGTPKSRASCRSSTRMP